MGPVEGLLGSGVGAGLPGVLKGAQIGLHGLGAVWVAGLLVGCTLGYAGRADRGPP